MNVLKALKLLEKETQAEVHLTGEYLRNTIRKKKHTGTIEVVVRHMNFKNVLKWLRKHGRVSIVKRGLPIALFKTNGDSREVLIRLPRKGKDYNPRHSLRDDAASGSFTFDSMYLPIKCKVIKNQVIDHFDGLGDIQNRKIRTIGKPQLVIDRDPIAMIKAVALSGTLKYRLDTNLYYAIKASANKISREDWNEIRKYFVSILLSPKPSKQFKLMHDDGLLRHILPELDNCYGVTQNKKYHKHDVFTHCVLSCDNAEPRIDIRLAALLHDVGKVATREEDNNGKITFYSHEVVGAKLATAALRRFGFDKKLIKTVSNLIYLHMYNYEPEKWTDTAVRRFIDKARIKEEDMKDLSNFPLFLLRRAERLSYGHNVHAVSLRQQQFEARILEIFNQSKALTIKDLALSGTDIINIFKLVPGPAVGNIQKYLLEEVVKNPDVNNKDVLVKIAANYMSEVVR